MRGFNLGTREPQGFLAKLTRLHFEGSVGDMHELTGFTSDGLGLWKLLGLTESGYSHFKGSQSYLWV